MSNKPPYQVWQRPRRGHEPWQKLGAPHPSLAAALHAAGLHQLQMTRADGEFTYLILADGQSLPHDQRDLRCPRRHY
jgi:hypothetical protein